MRGLCFSAAILFGFVFAFTACREDSPDTKALSFTFTESSTSIDEGSGKRDFSLSLDSPANEDEEFTVAVNDSTSSYGREYITVPDGTTKTFKVTIPRGSSSTTFSVFPILNSASEGLKYVRFRVTSFSSRVKPGVNRSLTLAISDKDLVCHLPFSGDFVDRSSYNNQTTAEGITATTDRKGSLASAYSFDGVNDFISINNSNILNGMQQLTLAAWIKPVSFYGLGNDVLIEKPAPSHVNPFYQYKLGISGDSYPNFPGAFLFTLAVNGNYQFVVTDPGTWSAGNWYFVVGTYDGTDMKIYVNGVLQKTKMVIGQVTGYGRDVFVGRFINRGVFTPGTIDDVRIYNRALSANEISQLFSR